MKTITSADELQEAIALLENKRAEQEFELQQEMAGMYENLKPVNIIKNSLHGVFASTNGKPNNIIRSAIGLGSSLLTKKLIGGKTSFLKKAIGAAVQFGVTGLLANKLFSKKKKPKLLK